MGTALLSMWDVSPTEGEVGEAQPP
jgi:hypothetical protein